MDLLTVEQYNAFSTGFGAPAGGHVDLRVVGIYRVPNPVNGFNGFIAAPAFYRAHNAQAIAGGLLIGTRTHSDVGLIKAQAAALDAALIKRFGRAQVPYIDAYLPRTSNDPGLAPTRAVLRSGLFALLGVVVAAGLILVGQLAGRWAVQGRESQGVEHALGLRARERMTARLLAAAPAIVIAVGLAWLGALLGGFVSPLGSMEHYEPTPGWLPRPLYGVIGAVIVAIATAVVVVVTTLRAGRVRHAAASQPGRWRNSLSLPRVALFATALTSRVGSARTSLPIRSMVVGLATMLAALVVVGDVHDQLTPLAERPAAWGWTADFAVADTTPSIDARLVADPRTRDVERLLDAPVTITHGTQRVNLTGYGRQTLKGRLPWTVVSGRIPTRTGEVALGPRAASDLGVEVGDSVDFIAADGHAVATQLVGTVVDPDLEAGGLGDNALLTAAGLTRVATHDGYTSVAVRARNESDRQALVSGLGSRVELLTPVVPRTIDALASLGTASRVLLIVLLIAALLLVAQNARLVRRRRGDQVAIADAMGMPARDLTASVVAALLVTSALAAVVGLPFGWAVSRIVLVEIAPRLGIGLHTPDVLPAVLVGAGVLVATGLIALLAVALAAGRPSQPAQE